MVERTVGAFTIPKGDIVMMCLPAGNKDPRYWSDAESFRPSRFATGEDLSFVVCSQYSPLRVKG